MLYILTIVKRKRRNICDEIVRVLVEQTGGTREYKKCENTGNVLAVKTTS